MMRCVLLVWRVDLFFGCSASLLGGVWNDQKKWVLEKLWKSSKRPVEAMGFIEAFDLVVHHWVPPLSGWVKINCDASLKVEIRGRCWVAVFVITVGLFRSATCYNLTSSSIFLSELKASVHVNSGKWFQMCHHLIAGGGRYLNEFGSILHDIVEFSNRVEVIFGFISCECNSVTHGLSRRLIF